MKKAILMAALFTGLSLADYAQNNPAPSNGNASMMHSNLSPDQRAAKDAEHAEKSLGLNADQKAKWQAAALERINANEPIRDKMQGATTPEERQSIRQQMKSNNDRFESTVTAMLTSDQKAKYDQMKSERHGRGGKGGHHRNGGNPPSGQ